MIIFQNTRELLLANCMGCSFAILLRYGFRWHCAEHSSGTESYYVRE
jgi:hypothetical protein